MPPRRLAFLAAVVALGLTACSASHPHPNPRPTATHSIPTGWWPAGPPGLDIAGQVPHFRTQDDAERPFSLRWLEIPGATTLNGAMSQWAGEQEQQFLADNEPDADVPPEFSGSVEPIVNADGLVGVRAQVAEFLGANGSFAHRTWYSEPAHNTLWGAGDLIADRAGLWRAALTGKDTTVTKARGETVVRTAGPLEAASPPASDGADTLTDVWFTPTGDLALGIDQGTVLPRSDGAQVVTLPAATAAPLLSDVGRRVQRAFRAPTRSSAAPVPQPAAPSSAVAASSLPAVDCEQQHCVALTFDDGPGPYTDKILDALSAAHAPATFFVLGDHAAASPQVVRRATQLGMAVGSHTWNHRQLTKLPAAQQADEQKRTAALLASLGGRPDLLRPPYGSFDAATRKLGAALVLWNIDTEDWKNKNTATTTARALAAPPGSIILMHDVQPTTADAIPAIVAGLRARGDVLVTVPQLYGGPLKPGAAYFSRHDIR